MTILFYIMFAMVAAGAIIAYIEGEKELFNKYKQGGK